MCRVTAAPANRLNNVCVQCVVSLLPQLIEPPIFVSNCAVPTVLTGATVLCQLCCANCAVPTVLCQLYCANCVNRANCVTGATVLCQLCCANCVKRANCVTGATVLCQLCCANCANNNFCVQCVASLLLQLIEATMFVSNVSRHCCPS